MIFRVILGADFEFGVKNYLCTVILWNNQAKITFLKLKARFDVLFSGLPAIAGGYEPETLRESSSNLPEHHSNPPLSAKKTFAWLRGHFVAENGVKSTILVIPFRNL